MAGNVLRQRIPWGTSGESTSLLASEAEAAGIELETIASEGGALAAFESAEAAGAALDSTGIAAPVGLAIGALAAIGYGGYEIYEHFIKSGVPEHKIPTPQQINRNMRINKAKIEEHKQHLENQKGIDYTETETGDEVNDVETFEKQIQSGLTLPFSNNIGPGNTPQAPKTIADSIAYDHDIAYGKAHHPNDVFSADDEFLSQQKTNFLFNGNPIEKAQSAIGYAGIKLKNSFEKYAGVKYPSNLSDEQPSTSRAAAQANKRPATSSSDTVNKAPKPNPVQSVQAVQEAAIGSTSDVSSDVQMDLPGTGKPSGDNGSPGGDEYYLPIKRTDFGRRNTTYSKTFQVVSNNFHSKLLVLDEFNTMFITSELLEIPWHLPCMYMTPSEYSLLQPGAHATKMCCKVTFRGCTIKFETNASSTQIATLNTVQTLRAAVGLNKTGWGNNFFYSALDPNDPMVPTTVVPSNYTATSGRNATLTQELYGDGNRLIVPGCYNTGEFWIGRNYWCESSTYPTVNGSIGWPTARTQKCKTWDAKTMIDKVIVDECYTPKMAPLNDTIKHYRETLRPIGAGDTSWTVNTGGSLADARTTRVAQASGVTGLQEGTLNPQDALPVYNIQTPIEKSQTTKCGPWGQLHPQIQPSINVGVQSVPQLGSINYISGVYSNLVQASSYFDVELTMDVTEYNPTHYNYLAQANVPAGDAIYSTSAVAPDQVYSSTYAGLYINP